MADQNAILYLTNGRRSLVHEGLLMCRVGNERKSFSAYLLSDMLLLAEQTKGYRVLYEVIPLDGLTMKDTTPSNGMLDFNILISNTH